MSTISQTPKINTARDMNINIVNLFIIAALVVTLIAIFNVVSGSPATKPADHSAYMLYRLGEWTSVPLSNQEAYQIFRRGEVLSPVTNAEAYQMFRLGEWASVSLPAVDLSAYRLSEQTLTDPNAGLTMFHLSERTLTDPQADLAAYFNSERTLLPAPFTQFQLSEWFGQ